MLTELSPIHLLLQLVLKVTILLVVTAATSVLLRKRSAAVRHLLWFCCAVGLLVMPLLTVVLPSLQLPVLNLAVDETDTALSPTGKQSVRSDPISEIPTAGRQASSLPAPLVNTDSPSLPSLSDSGRGTFQKRSALALASIWLAGTALLLASRFAGDRYLSKFIKRCRLIEPDQRAASVLTECADALGLRAPLLLTSENASLPFACRQFRSTVILPDAAREWDEEKLRPVLMHELAHIKRLDCLTQFVAHCARALFWFHPLAWWMTWQMHIEREIACDDMVLQTGHEPSRYGKVLLRLATEIDTPGNLPVGAIAMASKSTLERRLRALLDPMKNRGSVSLRILIVALGVTTLVAVPLAALRATPQVPESDTELVCQPQKLRPLSTEHLIRIGTKEPGIPWALEELGSRARNGQLTRAEAESFLSAMTASIRSNPSLCDSPLLWLQEFIRTLKEQQLVSDEKILEYLQACLSSPKLKSVLHLHATDRAILLINWRNVWYQELFGFVLLNEMKSITLDGKPVKVRSSSYTVSSSIFHGDLHLPPLAPGRHIIRCEIVSALVATADTAGLSDHASSEAWPSTRVRWERSVETDLLVDGTGSVAMVHAPADPSLLR